MGYIANAIKEAYTVATRARPGAGHPTWDDLPGPMQDIIVSVWYAGRCFEAAAIRQGLELFPPGGEAPKPIDTRS